jgi:hypothetical protein
MPRWPKRPAPPFRSSAPASWNAGKSSAARLHLRLLTAMRSALVEVEKCDVQSGQLLEACAGLRSSAEAIDAQLVAASRLPIARRQRVLLGLRGQVDEVERTAHRIAVSAIEAQGLGNAAASLDEVNSRLDSLEQARRELANPTMPKGNLSARASLEIGKLRGRRKRPD